MSLDNNSSFMDPDLTDSGSRLGHFDLQSFDVVIFKCNLLRNVTVFLTVPRLRHIIRLIS